MAHFLLWVALLASEYDFYSLFYIFPTLSTNSSFTFVELALWSVCNLSYLKFATKKGQVLSLIAQQTEFSQDSTHTSCTFGI